MDPSKLPRPASLGGAALSLLALGLPAFAGSVALPELNARVQKISKACLKLRDPQDMVTKSIDGTVAVEQRDPAKKAVYFRAPADPVKYLVTHTTEICNDEIVKVAQKLHEAQLTQNKIDQAGAAMASHADALVATSEASHGLVGNDSSRLAALYGELEVKLADLNRQIGDKKSGMAGEILKQYQENRKHVWKKIHDLAAKNPQASQPAVSRSKDVIRSLDIYFEDNIKDKVYAGLLGLAITTQKAVADSERARSRFQGNAAVARQSQTEEGQLSSVSGAEKVDTMGAGAAPSSAASSSAAPSSVAPSSAASSSAAPSSAAPSSVAPSSAASSSAAPSSVAPSSAAAPSLTPGPGADNYKMNTADVVKINQDAGILPQVGQTGQASRSSQSPAMETPSVGSVLESLQEKRGSKCFNMASGLEEACVGP